MIQARMQPFFDVVAISVEALITAVVQSVRTYVINLYRQ
jgi:hypothetical protein